MPLLAHPKPIQISLGHAHVKAGPPQQPTDNQATTADVYWQIARALASAGPELLQQSLMPGSGRTVNNQSRAR